MGPAGSQPLTSRETEVPAVLRPSLLAFPALILWGSLALPSQPIDLTLSQSALGALPENARTNYSQALEDFDHAYPEGGLKHLARAAELAPESVELQFLLADKALDQVERLRGQEALNAIGMAEDAYRRVIDNPESSDEDAARAQTGLDGLSEEMTRLGDRERRRREAGDSFIREFSALQERIEAARNRPPTRRRVAPPPNPAAPNPTLMTSDESRRQFRVTGRQRTEQTSAPAATSPTR
jgi:hypothetical protein